MRSVAVLVVERSTLILRKRGEKSKNEGSRKAESGISRRKDKVNNGEIEGNCAGK